MFGTRYQRLVCSPRLLCCPNSAFVRCMICFPGFYLPRFSPAVWMAHLALCSRLNAVCLHRAQWDYCLLAIQTDCGSKAAKDLDPRRSGTTLTSLSELTAHDKLLSFSPRKWPPASLQIKPFRAWFLRFFSPSILRLSKSQVKMWKSRVLNRAMVFLVRVLSLPVSHHPWVSQFSSPPIPVSSSSHEDIIRHDHTSSWNPDMLCLWHFPSLPGSSLYQERKWGWWGISCF